MPHTAHAGLLAALRCACGYQAIARICGMNAPPGDEGLTGSPTSTTKGLTTASHGPNTLVWKRQPCAFHQMQACSQKTLLHKVPHVTVPEPSENPLQMLGKKITSTVKACLTTLSRMVAIAPMAKTKRYCEGAVSSGPISSSSL